MKNNLIVIGPLPPPYYGQSIGFDSLCKELEDHYGYHYTSELFGELWAYCKGQWNYDIRFIAHFVFLAFKANWTIGDMKNLLCDLSDSVAVKIERIG